MIRLICPNCQSKLDAKDEAAGRVKRCPKCNTALRIPDAGSHNVVAEEALVLDDAVPGQHVHGALDHDLREIHHGPERLTRSNRYLICDQTKVIATWQDNGQGWMVKTSGGFGQARRNSDRLPSQGNFSLVELVMEASDEGIRLRDISVYDLVKHWALTVLDKGDDNILAKISGEGNLSRRQKAAVQSFLHQQFMREVWGEARNVLDYLSNLDAEEVE